MTALDLARLSAWMVVAVYVVSLCQECLRRSEQVRRRTWTLGALALSAHVAWTLMAVHHGSLKEAYAHTALKTENLIGMRLGEGLYVNFIMLAAWLADAVAWWVAPSWNQFRRKYVFFLNLAFSFMFLNAAIVFASPLGRAFGIVALASVIIGALIARRPHSRQVGSARERRKE